MVGARRISVNSTGTFLLAILGFWFAQKWWPIITMKGLDAKVVPFVVGTRVLLLALFVVIAALVGISWRRKRASETDGIEITAAAGGSGGQRPERTQSGESASGPISGGKP